MKRAIERDFIRFGRQGKAMYQDELIALIPRMYNHRVGRLDGCCSLVFDVYDIATHSVAGEIALRLGDGEGLFYLGHIGYHIDPPYRGKSMALHACKLCLPVIEAFDMRSFVITTDDDNIPSILTCERLGCVLESKVKVPLWCQHEYEISSFKRRYVYAFEKA